MADDRNQRGGADRSHINVHQEHELRYWTEALGVNADELRRAVDTVGTSASAVRSHLKR